MLGFCRTTTRSFAHGLSWALGDVRPKHSPSLHHLLKTVKGRQYLVDLVMADHPLVYQAKEIQLNEAAPFSFERLQDVIEKIALMR